jgi:hypothetical protein
VRYGRYIDLGHRVVVKLLWGPHPAGIASTLMSAAAIHREYVLPARIRMNSY